MKEIISKTINLITLIIPIIFRLSEARLSGNHEIEYDRLLQFYNYSSFMLSEFDKMETNDSSIVGGYIVDSPDEYPYIVSIMEWDVFSDVGVHQCAGSLIAPDVVLTAAHCVDNSAFRVVNTGRFSWKDNSNVEAFHVTQTYIHPDYNGDFFVNDVALLKLSGKAMVNLAHLHLGEDTINIGKTITSIGWGLTSDGGYPSPDLRAVDVRVISNIQCQYYYGKFITDAMVCAYEYGKDACQGDSGGPAMYTDSNGITYQVGVISWGDSCGKNPGVYTNLESPIIMKFINKIMCERLVPEGCIHGIFYGPRNNKDDIIDMADGQKSDNDSTESTSEFVSESKSTAPIEIEISKIKDVDVQNTEINVDESNDFDSVQSVTSKATFLKPSIIIAMITLVVIVIN